MAKKQNLLQQEKKSLNLNIEYTDPCPVCSKNLYYDENFSRRIALLNKGGIEGWQCPYCDCQFDLNDNFVYINTKENRAGKA